MGDIIEGVGDEVVLFGGFIILSVVFLIVISLWQRRRESETPTRESVQDQRESHAHTEEHPNSDEVQDSTSTGQQSGSEGLRHRSHVTVTPAPSFTPNESESASSTPLQQPGDGGGRGSSDGSHRNEITIRLIQAGGPGHAREVSVSPNTTLGDLRGTYFQLEVSEHRPVKFIYQGRILSDDSVTFAVLNIGNGGAMHVHVGRPRPPGTPPEAAEPEVLDLSRFFVPLFGLILGIVWVLMLLYPYVFTLMSKLFLFLLSIGYVVLAYISAYGN